MSTKTCQEITCDVCASGPLTLRELAPKPDAWKHLSYDLDGEIFQGIDICPSCLDPVNQEQTARKIGEIIMQSIGGVW